MPQFLPAFVIVGAKVVGGFLLGNTLTGAIARTVLSFAVSSLLARKPKTPPAAIAADQGMDVNLRISPDEPGVILYGTAATGGALAWRGVRGTQNDYLEQVIRLSDYRCDSVVKIIGDGEDLTFTGDVTTGYRACTSHYLDESGQPCLWVRVALGDPDQTADTELAANYSEISADFRGRGRAYAITRMKWNRDAYPNGPARLTYVMKGAPVYDPRLDSTVTGGSGTHRRDDASTFEWSDNPALIAVQYHQGWYLNNILLGGMGYAAERMPVADLIEAANECDELVALAAGGSEKRYRCGGGFLFGRNGRRHRANLEQVLNAMDGELDDGSGLNIRVIPGVERTPVPFEIRMSDVLQEDIDFNPEIEPGEDINQATCRFTDPDEGYRPFEVPLRSDATALARANGQEYTFDEDIPAVQSFTQAQRILKRKINRAQAPRTLNLSLPLSYVRLEKGDRVPLDAEFVRRYRLPQKYYRVASRPLITPDLRLAVSLREHPDTIGAWTPGTDEVDKSTLSQTYPAIPALTLSGVTVSAIELEASAVKMPLVRMTWTANDPRIRVLVRAIALDGASPPAPVSPAQEWTANVAADIGQADIFVVAAEQYKVVYQLYFEGRYSVETVASAAITATANFEPTGIGGVSAADLAAAADDGTLTPSEKNLIVPYLASLITEYDAGSLVTRAAVYSVSSTAYSTAMGALDTYLDGLTSPVAWNTLTGNTTIVAATWTSTIEAAVAARDALVNAIETASGRNNVTIDGSGNINGIGTGDGSGVLNSRVGITAAGVVVYDGTGTGVTITGLGFNGDLNATFGAAWGSNLTGRPGELTDGRVAAGLASNGDIARNIPGAIKTGSDILSRTGGGTFTGDLAATAGADWGVNLSNRPTELTDGRITTALDASGILQTNIANASQIPTLPATQIGSGTFDNARIAASNVTQHQASLALAASQVTSGTFDVARVPDLTLAKISDAGTLAGLSAVAAPQISTGAVTTEKMAANAARTIGSEQSSGSRASAAFTEFELERLTATPVAGSTVLLDVRMGATEILSDMAWTMTVSSGLRDVWLRLIRDPDGTPVELAKRVLKESATGGPTAYATGHYSFLVEDSAHGGGSTTWALVVTSYTAGTTTLNSTTLSHNDITRSIIADEAKR